MNKSLIQQIFQKIGLKKIQEIQKIEVGFTNDVYSIDNQYILKIRKSGGDNDSMPKDIALCQHFAGELPVPQILYSDLSKTIINKPFFIYSKIHGENLYNVWHQCSEEERRSFIQQICGFLKTINQTDFHEFTTKFKIDTHKKWKDIINEELESLLVKHHKKQYLSKNVIFKIRRFIEKNRHVLDEEKMALTYWDVHFDNFIVSDGKIVGMLDFERTIFASIDYVLVLVRRMVNNPKKYASEHAEQFVQKEDYAKLMKWYKKFYPELFDLKNIEQRIDLYHLEHVLRDIYWYPEVKELKMELEKLIS